MVKVDFASPARILFGAGALQQVGAIAQEYGRKPLVVIGAGGANPLELSDLLDARRMDQRAFSVSSEPSVDLVRLGVQAAREASCDLVIAFGGGSVIDTGKAISGLFNNPGDPLDYLEVVGKNQPLKNPGLPLIAIPTTAGTGSEVTRNAVLYVPEHHVKVSLRSPFLLPKVALVDPELTFSLPPAVTGSTGMDALTQVLEPYVSQRANALTDLFCRDGLSRVSEALERAYRDGGDREAREAMSWTSLLGGLALANAGLGAVHGFAGVIGGMFAAPHGAICAALLPATTAMNVKALSKREPDHPALRRYLEIAHFLMGSERASIEDGIQHLDRLRVDLRIPSLSSYGITHADVPIIAEKSARASSMKANPIVLMQDELEEILLQSL